MHATLKSTGPAADREVSAHRLSMRGDVDKAMRCRHRRAMRNRNHCFEIAIFVHYPECSRTCVGPVF